MNLQIINIPVIRKFAASVMPQSENDQNEFDGMELGLEILDPSVKALQKLQSLQPTG